jgi:hypothetical protein
MEIQEKQDAFREHVIAYLVKLEVEVRALRMALVRADEPLVTDDQMTQFRALAGAQAENIGTSIRREFGLLDDNLR